MTATALPGEVRVLPSDAALAEDAASWIAELCSGLERFCFAASGGRTPQALYEALAAPAWRARVDWQSWHVFFGDERAVPPHDMASNYRLLHQSLLERVPVPAAQVHRMQAEATDLELAAASYSALLEDAAGTPPRLDLILLGLGADGHTASLFPGTEALEVTDRWVVRGRAPVEPHDRLTMTLPAINAAARVAFLVTGAEKGGALRGVLAGTVPAARVRPLHGELTWFLDAAAQASM